MKKTRVLAGSLATATVALFGAPGLASADPAPAQPLSGKTVFLDAGSSVASAAEQARKVADGRGGQVPCVNPVAIASNGTPDHSVNYAVAKMVEAALKSQGAKVILSRADDAGFGGCVDQRATAANTSGADLALSINSAVQEAAQRGFVLETAAPGATDPKVTARQAVNDSATTVVRNATRAGGFVPAQYLGGQDGIARTTNALTSLVNIPLIYANLGNLANADDAALLTSRAGQTQYASVLTNGVIQQLTGKVTPGTVVEQPVVAQPVAPQVDPVVPVTPAAPATPATPATPAAPAATAPSATAPAATAPTAPAQTPIVPAVPGAPATAAPVSPTTGTGTSPIVAGVPMLQGGATPSGTTTPQVTTPATGQGTSVTIPGLGQLALPQLPTVSIPGQAQPLGVNSLFEMGPKAADFLTSSQGQQLVNTLISSPQAFNSLQTAQGPAAAQEILKAILSAGAVLPK